MQDRDLDLTSGPFDGAPETAASPAWAVRGGLAGTSPAIRELRRQIEAVAASDAAVLIEGEPGVGKGLVARALCRLGKRADRPFVAVDASSLQGGCFESELFGHLPEGPGAEQREGLAGTADGGTLFFLSVCRLPPASQGPLARFAETGLIRPVGSSRERPVDVRLLASAVRDLRAEVAAGRFRSDLYFRLRGILLRVPSLRERREDLPLLAAHALSAAAARHGRPPAGFTEAARERLLAHPWAGNLRELAAVLEGALLRTPRGEPVPAEALRLDETPGAAEVRLREFRHGQERMIVLEALEAARWNVSAAARGLGISRVGLSKKIKVLGLKRPSPSGRTPRV